MKIHSACIENILTRIILLICFNMLILSVFADNPNSALLKVINFDKLRKTEPNLTGDGVNYSIVSRSLTYSSGIPQNDYKPDTNLKHLEKSRINCFGYTEPAQGFSQHSSSICSILLGSDAEKYTGLTPRASADVYEFWYFLGEHLLRTNLPDSDIITASFGSPVSDWWTRGFQAIAEHYNKTIIASIGNGKANSQPPLYPAAGSNAIGVGVVSSNLTDSNHPISFNLALPEYSSTGPTSAQTCKPDIVAPSNFAIPYENNYALKITDDFSSFAVPTVSAAAGLLTAKSKSEAALQSAFSRPAGNSLMRAILLNSAKKLPYWHKGNLSSEDDHIVPLDYSQGAGMLDVYGAYMHLIAGGEKTGNLGWDKNSINTTEPAAEKLYTMIVDEPNEKFITATLCWNFHYQKRFPFEAIPEKNTNLVLEIWASNPNDVNDYKLLDYSDSANDNTEHIYCKLDANYKQYDIVVAFNPENGETDYPEKENFALAWKISEPDTNIDDAWYDLNCDGNIDKDDMALLMENFIKSKSKSKNNDYLLGDININNQIDIEDLQQFAQKLLPADTPK